MMENIFWESDVWKKEEAQGQERDRVILHIDMNNFFASVECLMNPSLRAVPLAVCGDAEERHGIVLAKNELAKKCGIQTGQVIREAVQMCPGLQIVKPHYDAYLKISRLAQKIYREFTDLVEPFGIDEVWADVTGSQTLFGDGMTIAQTIRTRIKEELGVTVSIGVSFNKTIAKLASDLKKPDAITYIPRERFREAVWKLPVSALLGAGRATVRALASVGIFTVGQLANFPPEYVKRKFGKCGVDLWICANGRERMPVLPFGFFGEREEAVDKSVGHGITTLRDMETADDVHRVMLLLTQEIGHRLLGAEKQARGVSVVARDCELRTWVWQTKLRCPTQSPSYLADAAYALFCKQYGWQKPLRSICVRATDLVSCSEAVQLDIFSDSQRCDKQENIDRTVDRLRARFGKNIVCNASVLQLDFVPAVLQMATMPSGKRAIGG